MASWSSFDPTASPVEIPCIPHHSGTQTSCLWVPGKSTTTACFFTGLGVSSEISLELWLNWVDFIYIYIPEEPRTHEIAGTWKNTMFSQKTRCFWFSMFSDLFAISHAIMILIIFDMIHLILSPCIPKPWVYTSTEHYTKPFWPPGVNRKCKMLQQIRMECMGLHLAHAESDVSN